MVTEIAFEVPGVPVGKGRPRFARMGSAVRTYTPAKTAGYERLVGLRAAAAMAGREPFGGAVELTVEIRMPVPTSWPRAKREAALRGTSWPTGKPDVDNVVKAVEDGMAGVVFADDKQVVSIVARKLYHATPGVDVLVREIAA